MSSDDGRRSFGEAMRGFANYPFTFEFYSEDVRDVRDAVPFALGPRGSHAHDDTATESKRRLRVGARPKPCRNPMLTGPQGDGFPDRERMGLPQREREDVPCLPIRL